MPYSSTMKFVFIDLDGKFTEAIEDQFSDQENVAAIIAQVQDLPRENTAFVSPANSLCFFDGGIDYVYSRKMFPLCEKLIRLRLQDMVDAGETNVSLLGRPYLPIGSAMSYTADEATSTVLIASPTMLQPQDVSQTENARSCMFAVLQALEEYNAISNFAIETCVVPALCCGYGKMDPKEAAKQCKQAFDDFYMFGARSDYKVFEHQDTSDLTLLYEQDLPSTQPKYYVNSEFFIIKPDVTVKQKMS